MGEQKYTNDNKNYLLTIGLGPCTGIAISVKCDNEVFRFLAHVDMGEIMGTITDFQDKVDKFNKNIGERKVESIEVKFVSSESYSDMKKLSDKEKRLID